MLKKLFSSILVSLLLLPNIGKSLETSWEGINEAKIRIISPFSNTNSSNHFIVGLEYKLENTIPYSVCLELVRLRLSMKTDKLSAAPTKPSRDSLSDL